MSRRELGKLSVGDEVFVIPSPAGRRDDRPISERAIPARVTKVARVWIGLESVERRETIVGFRPVLTWRMRMDTQHDGGDTSQYRSSFMTAEQLTYAERLEAAFRLLREQRIRIEWDSPWAADERRMLLADLIHAALKDEPESGPQ